MNKILLKILISTLILLIGIGAVSAIEFNSTNETISFEQNNEISINENMCNITSAENNEEDVLSVIDDSDEVISLETNDNNFISINNNNTDIIRAENNEENMSITLVSIENNKEIVSAGNNNDIISASINENEKLELAPDCSIVSYDTFEGNDGYMHEMKSKAFLIGKMTLHKKYWKMFLNQKKKTKKFKKLYKKKIKQLKRAISKKMKKLKRNGWYGSYNEGYDDIKRKGKYYVFYYYGDFYKQIY